MQYLSAEWFQAVLDSMTEVVLVKGEKSRILWGNKAMRDLYGMSEEELYNIVDGPQSDPDNTLQYVKDDLFVYENKTPLFVPYEEGTTHDNQPFALCTIKTPVLDEDGNTALTVGVSRYVDLDEKFENKASHKDGKFLTKPFRHLASYFPAPKILLDANCRIVSVSDSWSKAFGESDLTASSEFQLTFPKLQEILPALRGAIKKKKQIILENIAAPTLKGSEKRYDFYITPWLYEDQTLGGLIVGAFDVTKLREQEARLIKQNDELAQFAYRASHDLKAPISTTKRMIEYIIKDLESGNLEEAKRNLSRIASKMSSLEGLVSDILDLAKADLKEELFESVVLDAWLKEILGDALQEADAVGVKMVIQCDASLKLEIQRTRLAQVIENLVRNSLKFRNMTRPVPEVTVSVSTFHNQLKISVSDNGLGIPAERHSEVFQRFKRFHADNIPGSGLGLAIVARHVQAMQGKITFQSSDAGTRFDVMLPIKGV